MLGFPSSRLETDMTSHDRAFVRVAACCWAVTSLTTLGLIFIPRSIHVAPDIESQATLAQNGLYLLRVWTGVLHPLIALVGAAGVLVVRLRAAGALALCAFAFFML